jgi:hypothetical protein
MIVQVIECRHGRQGGPQSSHWNRGGKSDVLEPGGSDDPATSERSQKR